MTADECVNRGERVLIQLLAKAARSWSRTSVEVLHQHDVALKRIDTGVHERVAIGRDVEPGAGQGRRTYIQCAHLRSLVSERIETRESRGRRAVVKNPDRIVA